MVTSLFVDGVAAATGVPMSFGTSRSTTCPLSLNTDVQGAGTEHGAGDVLDVKTSDRSGTAKVDVVAPPLDPVRESITRKLGLLPSRTTSPHDTADAAMPRRATVLITFLKLRMGVISLTP